ncbi:MAG: DUF2723 domain-containing protein, partial [Candidatus Firestonebacteria bacterium]
MKKCTGAVLLFTALSVYIFTACPTIYPGDSGEIVTAAYFLGIPHPPGYPLYMLLGKLFTFLPAGTIAFRVNLLAAFFGGLGAFLLYLVLRATGKKYFTDNYLLAAAASLVFAFSLTYWQQCTQAKGGIYTLNIFLLLVIFLLLLKEGSLLLLAVITGLALANHNTTAPLALAVYLYMLYTAGKKKESGIGQKVLLFPIAAGLTAFLIYLYLPIRSLANPPMDWGNPETAGNFFKHIFREQYGTVAGTERSLPLFFRQLGVYCSSLFSQFTPLPALLGAAGAVVFFKKTKSFASLLAAIFLLTGVGFLLLTNFSINSNNIYMINVFYIPSFLVLIIFMYAAGSIKNYGRALTIVVALTAAATLVFNFSSNNRSSNYIARDFGRNILKSAEKGSILTVAGDSTAFTTAYLLMVEKKIPGPAVYDDYGLIFSRGDAELEKIPAEDYLKRLDYVKAKTLSSSLSFFSMGSSIHKDIATLKGLRLSAVPFGTVYRIVKTGDKPEYPDVSLFPLSYEKDESSKKDFLARSMAATYYYFCGEYFRIKGRKEDAKLAYAKAAGIGADDQTILDLLGALYQQEGNIGDALVSSKKAVELDPYSSEMWNNYGAALSKAGRNTEALEAYAKAVKLNGRVVTYYNNLAAAYFNTGNPAKALEVYNSAAALNPAGVDNYGLGATL